VGVEGGDAAVHQPRPRLPRPPPHDFWLRPTPPRVLSRSVSRAVSVGLPADHRLGPFPPRGPPWAKLAAIRYLLRRHAHLAYIDSDVFVTEVWQPLPPLLEATGLLRGERWIAAAEEFPPQKLRRDTRAGLANSGVLLLAGAPIAGAGILRAIEEWIWPVGNPTWSFKWPFEQNALTTVVFRRYPRRYTLLKPGCPLNSPFGALLRHLVGGTPHRAVYHPDHRTAWLAEALLSPGPSSAQTGEPSRTLLGPFSDPSRILLGSFSRTLPAGAPLHHPGAQPLRRQPRAARAMHAQRGAVRGRLARLRRGRQELAPHHAPLAYRPRAPPRGGRRGVLRPLQRRRGVRRVDIFVEVARVGP